MKNVDFLVNNYTVAELRTPEIANLFPAAVSLLLGVLQPRWPLATVCSSSNGKFGPWLVQAEDLSSSKESTVPGNRLGGQCSMSLLLLLILKHQQFFLSLFTLMINLIETHIEYHSTVLEYANIKAS